MAIDVSVVIPFFNSGPDIDDAVTSMLAQKLPRDRFEVILVDDGSSDGTSELVDAWAARYPELLTVLHLSRSGGPAHPRNVGIEAARGRYIQFVDSDDSLAPAALTRLLAIADESDADIVIGKISSDFRGVYQPMFRTTVTRRTVTDFPLMQNLTVCKMFRREFLLAHDIRLPEGPTYIEDQHLCVQAYGHAKSVAVVADTVCYLYRRRRHTGLNHGDEAIDPAAYFRELAAIFDIIDGPDFPAEARLEAYTRYYRNEMLGRLRGTAMLGYDGDYRAALIGEVRGLASLRLPPAVHEGLPVFQRAQSQLLRDGADEGLLELARQLSEIALRATTAAVRWRDGALVISVSAFLQRGSEPLRLVHDTEGWMLPEELAPGVGAANRRLRADDAVDLDLVTTSRADGTMWSTTDGLRLEIDSDGSIEIHGDVTIDPRSVAGGGALPEGLWDFRLRVGFGGITWGSPLRASSSPPRLDGWIGAVPYWSEGSSSLCLDVGQWMHPLQDLVESAPAARTAGSRTLVIDVPRLRGADETTPVSIILEPVSAQPVSTRECTAELLTQPDGSTIRARVPVLDGDVERWHVWLRLGAVGTVAARRLPVDLRRGRLRRLQISSCPLPDSQEL